MSEQYDDFELPPDGQITDVTHHLWACEVCGCLRPMDEFFVRGQPGKECHSCQRTRPLRAYHQREQKNRGKQFKKLVSLLAGEKLGATANAAGIEQLNGALMEQFGGIDGLAREFYEQYLLVKEHNPGSYTAIKAIEGVMKVVTETSKLHGAGDPKELDDEELEAVLIQQLLRVAQDKPEVAEKVAAVLGGDPEALPPHLADDNETDEDDHGND